MRFKGLCPVLLASAPKMPVGAFIAICGGDLMQQEDFTRNPKAALWRFIGTLAATALFWWMASIGWPGARFVFWVFVLLSALAFLDVLRAHRAWKLANVLFKESQNTSGRYDTNPQRGSGDGPRPDNWD